MAMERDYAREREEAIRAEDDRQKRGRIQAMERNYDRVEALRDEVERQKETMVKNIEEITSRGERLEDLGEYAPLLKKNADRFQRTATMLKRRMWWQNIKMWLIVLFVILVILIIIAVIIALAVTGKFK